MRHIHEGFADDVDGRGGSDRQVPTARDGTLTLRRPWCGSFYVNGGRGYETRETRDVGRELKQNYTINTCTFALYVSKCCARTAPRHFFLQQRTPRRWRSRKKQRSKSKIHPTTKQLDVDDDDLGFGGLVCRSTT